MTAPVAEVGAGYVAGEAPGGRSAAGRAVSVGVAPACLGGEAPGGRSAAGRTVSVRVAPGRLGGDVLGGATPRVSPADRGVAL